MYKSTEGKSWSLPIDYLIKNKLNLYETSGQKGVT